MDYVQEFIVAMTSAGCGPARSGDVVADGKWHDYQIAGDPKGKKKGFYVLNYDDGFAIGRFGDRRHGGDSEPWNSRSNKKFSPEEKQEWNRKRAVGIRAAIEDERREHETLSLEAQMTWKESDVADSSHPYLIRKSSMVNGIRQNVDGELVIPMWAEKRIWNIQTIDNKGEKLYGRGRKKGCYFALANADDDLSVIVIAEGYSTGDAIRQATGLPVLVSFDAGNMIAVAKSKSADFPETKFIFAADNDQWTFKRGKCPDDVKPKEVPGDSSEWENWRRNGWLVNPGIEAARQAAVAIGGASVVWPEFDPEDKNKRTDFNDALTTMGKEYVKDRITSVIKKAEVMDTPEPVINPDTDFDSQRFRGDPYYGDIQVNYELQSDIDIDEKEEFFNILGHDEGQYYFLPRRGGQIVSMAPVSLNQFVNLCRLAPLPHWNSLKEDNETNKKLAERMTAFLIMECENKGIFQPYNIKGVGMWKDGSNYVMHCGNQLFVNGNYIKPHKFKGKNAYPLRQTNIDITDNPLGNKEANKLRELCKRVSWENTLSGDLLAGWCVIAPVCAVLKWRPHIWVTGPSQGGKTTVLEKIVRRMVGNIGLYFEGGTTEAAFRQLLGCDGRPIILDESESESQKDKVITQDILLLARRSSSGAMIAKGSSGGKAQEYTVRSAFCFSSINTPIKQRADESRISKLKIVKDRSEGATDKYKNLEIDLDTILTEEFGKRLLTRTVLNIENLIKNINTFVSAASNVLKDKRAADQIAPMLAGLHLLTSTKEISLEEAIQWIGQQDWSLHTAIKEKTDPERFIEIVVSRSIRFQKSGTIQEVTIGSLIEMALDNGAESEDAERKLREYGIWPRDKFVWLSNTSPRLEELLKDTPWSSWKGFIIDLKDSERKEAVLFSPGLKSRAVAIPLSYFDIKEDDKAVQLTYDDELEIEF